MNIMALETSAQPGGIALLRDDQIVHESRLPENQRTTESFANEIRQALCRVDWRPQDVELMAVCEGPGSFTGLRIGVTAAKVFGYATSAEVLALPTMEVLASQAVDFGAPEIWVTVDAQRKQLFVARYQFHATGPVASDPPQIVDAHAWLSALARGTAVTGSGLEGYRSAIPAGVECPPETSWSVQASGLARLAGSRFRRGMRQDLWQLVPKYYRKSAAEEKLANRSHP